MSTEFFNLSFIYYHNLICIPNRAKTMSNYNNCSVLKCGIQRCNNLLFINSVKRVGGFIEEQIMRITIQSSCDEQALFLSAAKATPLLSYLRVKASWQIIQLMIIFTYSIKESCFSSFFFVNIYSRTILSPRFFTSSRISSLLLLHSFANSILVASI